MRLQGSGPNWQTALAQGECPAGVVGSGAAAGVGEAVEVSGTQPHSTTGIGRAAGRRLR